MREDLLGYLLSALEPHEMRRVDQRLRDDPQLREELAEVQRMLSGLDQSLGPDDVAEVPADLISRTMANIPSRCDSSRFDAVVAARDGAVAIRPVAEPPLRARRSWADLLVMTAASVAVAALLFPLAARLRSEARSAACQDNLRQLGVALSQFVSRDRESHLPALAETGPEAFSGMYAVRLADRGLLSDGRLRWCPATELPAYDLPTATPSEPAPSAAGGSPELTHLVIGDDLKRAADAGDVSLLRWLQRIAGGHYAYSLGVVDGTRYDAPQYEGRPSFAVLGDAPIAGHQVSDGVDVMKMRWSHGGEGANLLYEDGSVRHLRMSAMLGLTDHPFINHRGSVEAGVNVDDASLGPSWRAPFIEARQR